MSERVTGKVLGNFLDADGRLHTIPSKHGKLLVVLDFLAQRFEPGQRYPEARSTRSSASSTPTTPPCAATSSRTASSTAPTRTATGSTGASAGRVDV